MNNSLRRQLLAWVLLPLMIAVFGDAWLARTSALETASVVQDRLLLGSARMIAEQISFEDGAFQHQIPPAALELFQADQMDHIYYRVTTGAGQLLSGYTDLPLPKSPLSADSPFFFETTMRNEAVRVATFLQPVIGNPSALPVLVEVAQTMNGHRQLTYSLWLSALRQQLFILALVSIFILFGLHRGLQPLIRLRNDVRARKEGSLMTLETKGIPAELMSLVETFNDYIQRLERYTNHQSVFLQNAAHQLRTPLTVLNTQISDALQADNKPQADAPLVAARKTLQQTVRLVNQFLTLSSAEGAVAGQKRLSTQQCVEIVRQVLEDLAAQAHSKQMDLGFERSGCDTVIKIDSSALREITINLVENALRYTPPNGVVTVQVHSTAESITLVVEDNGPGVAKEDHEKIFQRFFRVGEADSSGSGLGLAIVKELATQCGAQIELGAPPLGGHGLWIAIKFIRR